MLPKSFKFYFSNSSSNFKFCGLDAVSGLIFVSSCFEKSVTILVALRLTLLAACETSLKLFSDYTHEDHWLSCSFLFFFIHCSIAYFNGNDVWLALQYSFTIASLKADATNKHSFSDAPFSASARENTVLKPWTRINHDCCTVCFSGTCVTDIHIDYNSLIQISQLITS